VIEDPSDPRVAAYMNLKDAHLAVLAGETPADRGAGLFMAEGELVVRTAIESDYRVRSVLITPARLRTMAGALERLDPATPVYEAGRDVIERVIGFDLHRGVLAACERGVERSATEVIERSRALVLVEDLANHDNMGGILRNVAALGGPDVGVLLSPRCCDPLYRKAIRVSMGHALRVTWARASSWEGTLDEVVGAGFEVIALATEGDEAGLARVTRPALALGAEGDGLSGAVLSRASRRARIPMAPGVDSLNVTVASGIALHRCLGAP